MLNSKSKNKNVIISALFSVLTLFFALNCGFSCSASLNSSCLPQNSYNEILIEEEETVDNENTNNEEDENDSQQKGKKQKKKHPKSTMTKKKMIFAHLPAN